MAAQMTDVSQPPTIQLLRQRIDDALSNPSNEHPFKESEIRSELAHSAALYVLWVLRAAENLNNAIVTEARSKHITIEGLPGVLFLRVFDVVELSRISPQSAKYYTVAIMHKIRDIRERIEGLKQRTFVGEVVKETEGGYGA